MDRMNAGPLGTKVEDMEEIQLTDEQRTRFQENYSKRAHSRLDKVREKSRRAYEEAQNCVLA